MLESKAPSQSLSPQNQEYLHSRLFANSRIRREMIDLTKSMNDSALASLGLDVAYDFGSNDLGLAIRSFCSSIPIPFHDFNGIRRSKGKVELTRMQKENVYKSFEAALRAVAAADGKKDLGKDLSTPLPFVSAFFFQRCPELQRDSSPSSSGATFLLLSVITGDTELCQRCLKAGANPNSMSFLQDKSSRSNLDMFHGYSPMFMAVLAEQIEIMDMLSAAGGIIHVYDRWGRTPLHAAVTMNSVEVVQWLLAKGAPRYVGDCLNILPAESAEEDYFPDLAMPNPALCGFPKKPSITYFIGLVEETKGPNQKTTPRGLALEEESIERCHCHSERPKGFCGCVDDMFLRWSMDRLDAMWSPGVDFFSLSQKSMVNDILM